MRRYLLFTGDNHYPDGGAEDFAKDFDNLQSAMDAAPLWVDEFGGMADWANIIDTETGRVWLSGEVNPHKTVWRDGT